MTMCGVITILCTLAPCVYAGGVLQVPVPEVHPREDMYTGPDVHGIKIRFVPLPRGA
jgi:hypothetical protein